MKKGSEKDILRSLLVLGGFCRIRRFHTVFKQNRILALAIRQGSLRSLTAFFLNRFAIWVRWGISSPKPLAWDRSLPPAVRESGRRSVGNRKECRSRHDYASFPGPQTPSPLRAVYDGFSFPAAHQRARARGGAAHPAPTAAAPSRCTARPTRTARPAPARSPCGRRAAS